MKRLALLGASGHGKVVADIAETIGYNEVVFFDDAWPNKRALGTWNIIGTTEDLIKQAPDFDACFVSIGVNKTRIEKYNLLKNMILTIPVLVHPNAAISRYVTLGHGTVVMAGAVINAGVDIAEACIINTGAIVDHDCTLDIGTHISPGASLAGEVKIGCSVWVGIGASIRQCISIGESAIIGAGATVINNIPAGKTAFGCPAICTD